jgi:hypothetical protein
MLHTTSTTRQRTLARYSALLAVPLLVGMLAACSGSDPKESEKPAGTEQTVQDWQVSFSACMRDEGIADYPDPEPDGTMKAGTTLDDADAQAMETASKTCLEQLGEPPAGPGGKVTDEELMEQNMKVAQCVRDSGYEMEDPKAGNQMTMSNDIPQDVIEKCIGEGGVVSSKN